MFKCVLLVSKLKSNYSIRDMHAHTRNVVVVISYFMAKLRLAVQCWSDCQILWRFFKSWPNYYYL